MPARQPFTQLCQVLARPRHFGRVDLHLHTTFSDGTYTPAQVVDLARRSGLSAIAITDHDTLGGVAPARQAAGDAIEVIAGVEITTEFRGRELHLLAYDVALDHRELTAALGQLRRDRSDRFHQMVERLATFGVRFQAADMAHLTETTTLGRRHLAEMLVRTRQAASVREAFQRWLGDEGRIAVPKVRLPVADALGLVRAASGVASWAHPTYDCSRESLGELKRLGLAAIEAEYPAFTTSRTKELRGWARELGLAITGGSDCHGPEPLHRAIGARSITHDDLARLRQSK